MLRWSATPFILDVEITKAGNELTTTIYRKPTDKNNVILFESHHPAPLKLSLPVSQLYRLKRICNTEGDYHSQSETMLNRFREKGYPESCLHTAVETVNKVERKTLFSKRTKIDRPHSVNYVLTYNPLSSTIKDTVSKYWHILESDRALNDTFKHPPLFTFKRATSLRDRLVKADSHTNKKTPIILGNFPCRSCTIKYLSRCTLRQRV